MGTVEEILGKGYRQKKPGVLWGEEQGFTIRLGVIPAQDERIAAAVLMNIERTLINRDFYITMPKFVKSIDRKTQ
jgi:hypothetical protein